MMTFSANLGFLWRDLPLPDAILAASEAGFDAVECHFPFAHDAGAVRAALSEGGFRMISLNARPGSRDGDFGLTAVAGREAEARNAIDEAIAYAAAIGCDHVHVLAGANGDRATYLDNLTYAADAAAQADQTVLIEPLSSGEVPGYHLTRVADAVSVITQLGTPNLGVLFDVFHVRAMGDDPLTAYQRSAEHVRHVQIAAHPDRGEPTGGDVDYARLLPGLVDAGYRGAFGAEYRPRDTIEAGLGWLDEWR